MEKPEVFYMVYLDGGDSPTIKHTSRNSADAEARRLTEKTRMSCYTLKAVGMHYSSQVLNPSYVTKGISIPDRSFDDDL